MTEAERNRPLHIGHVNLAKGFRGGERQTQLLISALSEQGLQQTVVIRADSPLKNLLEKLPNVRLVLCKKPYWRAIFKLPKVDLLHAHDGKAVHWCRLVKLTRSLPYVVTRRVPNKLKNSWLTKASYRNALRVVGLSQAIKQSIQAVIPGLPVTVIPSMNAQLTSDQDEVKALLQRYQGHFVIGHIGALVNKHKGQQYLIEAAQELTQRYPHMLFLLLGEGRDHALFAEQIGENPAIKLLGFHHNIGDYLSLFNVFVFPSLEEGLGSTLLDVMQAGVPIIASDVDGIPDIIEHKKNGLLVEPGNSRAIVDAIEMLYTNKPLAQKLVADGLTRVDQFSPSAISTRYLALYRELLSIDTDPSLSKTATPLTTTEAEENSLP